MGDPTKAEPRNPTYGGETIQETADRMAGGTKQHYAVPKPDTGPTAKPPGPSTHPNAPGGRNFGSPIDAPILAGGNK